MVGRRWNGREWGILFVVFLYPVYKSSYKEHMWLHNKVFVVVFFNNVRRPLTRGLMMVLHQQTYGPITFLRAVPEHDWTPSLQRDSCPPASCGTGCSLHCLLAGDRALRFTLRLRDLISNSLRERQDRNFYSRLYRGGSERILHQPSPHCHVTGKANKRTGREAGKLQALSPRRRGTYLSPAPEVWPARAEQALSSCGSVKNSSRCL